MKKQFGVVCVLALCLALAWPASAQVAGTTGSIQGTVVDPSGGVIPGAEVEARNIDTNYARSLTTDPDGRFIFLQLPSGRYKITVTKKGFATLIQENVILTVGQTIPLSLSMKVAAAAETITVSETPMVETLRTEASSTLNQTTVSTTPVLGRKFEDLLTLTPGVSIVQGPDGDEINFNGQRGIFNNIMLDGGDYNNGFFGEQPGGQRAVVDISMEAIKEFQVVPTGATAEFGRTASGVINVLTKSGTNEFHGSIFHFQRHESLSSNTSDGKPLTDFHREQFGTTSGGPIVKDKMFYYGSLEQITANLQRDNLSTPIGTPCPVAAPTVPANEALINSSTDCQRLALINFISTTRSQQEGLPVRRPAHNTAVFGKFDWSVTPRNQFNASYNFNRSNKVNETFDVATYGNSANGIEGASRIQVLNFNLSTIVSPTKLNEGHFTYSREARPRFAVASNVPADTAMGFVTTFRFGAPFFLEPKIDELIWRTHLKDNFSIILGRHTIKFGGEWLHTLNDQVFRGFFTGRYIFDTVDGFLRYAAPAAPWGVGPTVGECLSSTGAFVAWVTQPTPCPTGSSVGGPLIFYLQDGVPTGSPNVPPPGASKITNQDFGLFVQDKWQIWPNFTFNYGLRWEAQVLPDTVVPPAQTAYGIFLSNPNFPSDGTEHNQWKEFQPRIGFAWDVRNNRKSVLRASWGIYYARQNMLTQVGSITTNGAQQSTIFTISAFGGGPVWPNAFPVTPGITSCTLGTPVNPFPCFTGVRVFSKNYANPRIYTTNVAFEQEVHPNWSLYADFTWIKGVHLTRFLNFNNGGPPAVFPTNGDTVTYSGAAPFGPQLGDVFTASSLGKSLYRGFTAGMRKRFSQGFQMEWNYVYSVDKDDDSNERDPFTDRSFNRFNLSPDYANSDRDERHKFNFFTYAELPAGFQLDVRMQAHSAQPITDLTTAAPSGAPCSSTNSNTRVVNGIDCGRNHLRKNNEFFSFDWRLTRPIKLGERFRLIPIFEMFNTFNNDNNVNPLIVPGLFDFNGFLRVGVGDPRQAQLAVRFTW